MTGKRTKRTPEKVSSFLAALMIYGNVTKAANETGIDRQRWYEWRSGDVDFAKAWNEAAQIGVEALEDEARRRAFDGVDQPIYHLGNKIDTVKKYSDTLLIFLLKAHRPEKYRERQEISGPNGGPILTENLTDLDADERARRIASVLELAARNRTE